MNTSKNVCTPGTRFQFLSQKNLLMNHVGSLNFSIFGSQGESINIFSYCLQKLRQPRYFLKFLKLLLHVFGSHFTVHRK